MRGVGGSLGRQVKVERTARVKEKEITDRRVGERRMKIAGLWQGL